MSSVNTAKSDTGTTFLLIFASTVGYMIMTQAYLGTFTTYSVSSFSKTLSIVETSILKFYCKVTRQAD